MYMEIQVVEGRRVRHPVKRNKVYNADGEWHKVLWSPAWERKGRMGDIRARKIMKPRAGASEATK